MRLRRWVWAVPLGLILLAALPLSSATGSVHGPVTSCSSSTSCDFSLNTSAGTGWASTTSTQLSFQLPGEAKASYNLTYSTYIGSLTGTYTYWTVGNFLGTDVNTGKVVFGTTNTNYTITCVGHSGRGGGCHYTYTTDNGTIVFHLTQAELTATTVSCSPGTIDVASQATCTAKVTDLWNSSQVPTGKIHLTSGGLGTFASHGSCTLVAGQCSLAWHPFDSTVGSVTILATFTGSASFYKGTGTTTITVTGGG